MKDTHLTVEQIKNFYAGNVTAEQTDELMHHIAQCEKCADIFADFIGEQSHIEQLPQLGEQVKEKIRASAREFFVYSLKVIASCAAAIAITFSGICSYNMHSFKAPDVGTIQQTVREQWNGFSKNILNGGFFNAGQKK